jgi:hypothetical protein
MTKRIMAFNKRFWVFIYCQYEQYGMDEFSGSRSSKELAINFAKTNLTENKNCYQVFDSHTGKTFTQEKEYLEDKIKIPK